MNFGKLRSMDSILDKFYFIAFQYSDIDNKKLFRLLNNLRDSYILLNKMSKFDDEDIYQELDEEDEMFDEENFEDELIIPKTDSLKKTFQEYEDKMLNNLLIEYKLFDDLLAMFICSMNEQLLDINDSKLKDEINDYKNVVLFTYAKSNVELLDNNLNFENTIIQSKFLYDMLMFSDRELSYNYDIMKLDYLDKALYNFLKNIYSVKGYANTDLEKIVQSCYCKAIFTLYGDSYDRAISIFKSTRKL